MMRGRAGVMPGHVVYVLRDDHSRRRHYIGATHDIDHRLRQHNRELAGGAKATRGRSWHVQFVVTGFERWGSALRFERQLKIMIRKRRGKHRVHERHEWALHTVAGSPEWCTSGIAVRLMA